MYNWITIGECRILMGSARVQTSDKNEQGLKCFTEVDGKLRLVIDTAAAACKDYFEGKKLRYVSIF